MALRRVRDRFQRLARREDGIVAVEFAMIAPVMIVMLFGMIELTDAVMAKRRVGMAASTLGDLTTNTTVDWIRQENVEDLIGVTGAVLEPYGIGEVSIKLTCLTWDDTQDEMVVVWSREREAGSSLQVTDDSGYAQGNVFTGLAGKAIMLQAEELVRSDHHLVLVELSYPFSSSLSNIVFPQFSIGVRELRIPRRKPTLHFCTDEGCTDGRDWDAGSGEPGTV